MLVDYLKRGVLAGLGAGLAYGLFMAVVGNPLVEYMEALAHHDHGHEHGHAVSELTTAIVSVGSGVLWGILLGAAFALAYYVVEPSLPGPERLKPYVLALAGFLTVSGVPWLALPPVAPGTEQALATDTRLLLYGGLMVLGAVICALSVLAYNRTRERGTVVALGAALLPVSLVTIPILVVPQNTLGGPPSDLVMAFQGLVAFSQLALWALIAGSYRHLEHQSGRSPEAPAVEAELGASST